jgi:hypothetical protein
MTRYLVTLIAVGLLTGCATAPSLSLTTDDPADPAAPEAPGRPVPNALSTDGLTRKTRQILAQAAKEPQQSNQGSPTPDN